MTSTAQVVSIDSSQPLIRWSGKYFYKKTLVNIFFYLNPGEEIKQEDSYTCFRRISRRRKRIQEIEVSGTYIIEAKIVKPVKFKANYNERKVFFYSSAGDFNIDHKYIVFPTNESQGTDPYRVRGRKLTKVTPFHS